MAVYKRGNLWYSDYYITIDGKRERRRKPHGTRRKDAEEFSRSCQALVKAGIDPETNRPIGKAKVSKKDKARIINTYNLNDFFVIFMQRHASKLKEKTQSTYRERFKYLGAAFGETLLHEIEKEEFEEYRSERLENAAVSTVNIEFRNLRAILNKAVEWDYIEKNPIKGLKELPPDSLRDRFLSVDEYLRLMNAAQGDTKDIIQFALATGMRKSEIFNCSWSDIVLNSEKRSGLINVIGKGNKKRYVPINRTLYDLLQRRNNDSLWVFPSPKTDRPYTDIKKSFKTALKEAAIENFRFHDLRHTAASWLVQQGVSIYKVKDILGHSSVTTTQRYAHLAPDKLVDEVRKLDQTMQSSTQNEKAIALAT